MYIGITQRVVIRNEFERCDTIDQAWYELILQMGLIPILIPNNKHILYQYLSQFKFKGFILSGGNDLIEYNGDSPERDEIEKSILIYAIENKIPLLGVCRGMQLLNVFFNGTLKKVDGHVAVKHLINWGDVYKEVNSYHNWALDKINENFIIKSSSEDGIIEAFQHKSFKLYGIMWHPERESPKNIDDIKFLKEIFY